MRHLSMTRRVSHFHVVGATCSLGKIGHQYYPFTLFGLYTLLLWIITGLGEQILPRIICFYFIPEAADESRFRFLFVGRTR